MQNNMTMKNIHTFSKLNKGYQLVKSWLLAGCYGLPILITTLLLTFCVSNAWAAKQRYIYVGISKNYYDYKDGSKFGFNFWGGTSGGVKSGTYITTYNWDDRTYYMYRVQVYDDNNKAQFKGNDSWWDPGDGFSVTLNGTTNNAVFFSHSSDGWQGQFQQNYQVSSTSTLVADKTSITTTESSTLTPSLTSNATYNEIKSVSYSVTSNPSSAGSVTSGGVFTATAAGTYTVTATITYNAKDFSGITKTTSPTINITVTASAEETHDVTVYYKYGSTTVKTQTTESAVGVTTERTFTAPEIDGYNFFSYTFGSGLTMKSANTTTNPCRFVTKSTGTYELTVNYDIAPVKLLYGTTTPLNSPSNTAMTYDAYEKAYYVDVTTTASPYYFRFDYNNGTKQYAGDWSSYPNVNEVIANGAKVACATEVQGWENKSSLKFTGASSSSIRIWFSYKDKKTWITETTYTVTITNDGNGSTSPASVTAGKNTLSESFSATANTGYYFNNWTRTSGSVTITNSSSATTTTKATAASSIRANFLAQWYLPGSKTELGSWNTTANPFTGYVTAGGKNKGYFEATLLPNTTYEVKVYDRAGNSWYGIPSGAATSDVYYATSSTEWTMTNVSGNTNLNVHTTAGGTYTFEWNLTDKKLKVSYPTSWFITMGVNNASGGTLSAVDNLSNTVTNESFVANNATVTFTAAPNTGYHLVGWYSNSTCTTAYTHNGSTIVINDAAKTLTLSSITADKTVYAKFEPNNYTVTLDVDEANKGNIDGATTSQTIHYNEATTTVPNRPTAANGYGLMGYYTEQNGNGTKVINGDGTWIASVAGYTDGSKNWIHDDDVTLYAYYKQAEITSFTGLSAAYQPGATEEGVTANISPSPAGTTIVCWRVLYAENDDPITSQPTFTEAGANTVSFVMPEISGNYKLEATLRLGGSCESGDVLSTYTQQFNVAGSHNVTIQYKCGDVVIKESTVQSVAAFEATSITAPDIVGYTFSSWTLGEGVSIAGGTLTSSPISVTAIYTSTITANYTPKRMIYFKNTLGWSGVTVYFYKNDSYWNASKGTGSHHTDTYTNTPFSESKYGAMTQIEGTDIWYFDAEGAGVNASYTNVAFTEDTQYDYHFFYDTKVARRGDYKSSLPMFVPLAQTPVSMNDGHAKYYSEGYWMNYPENTGYKLRIYPAWNSDNASGASREYYFPYSADLQMPLKLDVELNTTDKIWFMVYRNDNVLMGKNYSVTQDNHETKLDKPSDQKLELNPSASGVYSFTLTFHDDGGSPKNYDYYINVDYPVSLGDYRIYYTDNATWSQGSAHAAGWHHTSDAIRKNTGSEEKSDTVSLFVSYGSSPSAKFQYVSAISGSTVTWTDVPSGTISLSGITEKGVYNFIVSQPTGGASISLSKTEKYTGNYYIRTDCAGNTKWDNFRARDHEMTYTEFSMSDANSFGEKFSHYFAHWCPAGTNVKFCIANDYSTSISDTLTQDVGNPYANIDAGGFLLSDGNSSETANRYSANIRFMYNETTNKISRAYVASSTNPARKFLILKGEGTSGCEIKDEDNVALNDAGVTNGAILHDNENFIYERVIYVKPGTRFKLFACYAEVTPTEANAQYFRGAYDSNNFTTNSNSVVLLGGEGDAQKLRVIYDFKTNRLVAAWMPSDVDVSGVLKIDADVMILRDHQEAAKCITFANAESKLDGVKTVYGAMKFNRWTLNNRYRGIGGEEDNDKDHCDTPADITMYHGILPSGSQKSIYERSLYFISFPFNVKVSEIFGFGHYWDEWYLEYYDGLTRAKNGYWLDSPSNWKYVTPEMAEDFVLEANKGYILGLDLDYMEYDNTTFWANNISNVELYFPSTVSVETLQSTNCTIPALNTIEGDPYRCTINRGTAEGDRRIKDSYWRCLGVPSFNIYNSALQDGSGNTITWKTNYNWVADDAAFPFLYAWNMTDNSLTVQGTSAFNFKPMHAYLAQIPGEIRWTAVSAKPSSIVARQKNSETNVNREWRLELQKDSTFMDQTYVRMSNLEQVTDTFDFGQDLVKELNATRSNIYTFVGYERLAANSMPIQTEQTTIVPLGLNIKTTGDYTFAMPDGTNGVGVTLVDTEANVRTSLSALDYTVNLTAGQYDSRFVLEISPVQEVITDIEPVSDSSLKGRAQKKMIDGILYIVRDGKIYDARGARIE